MHPNGWQVMPHAIGDGCERDYLIWCIDNARVKCIMLSRSIKVHALNFTWIFTGIFLTEICMNGYYIGLPCLFHFPQFFILMTNIMPRLRKSAGKFFLKIPGQMSNGKHHSKFYFCVFFVQSLFIPVCTIVSIIVSKIVMGTCGAFPVFAQFWCNWTTNSQSNNFHVLCLRTDNL